MVSRTWPDSNLQALGCQKGAYRTAEDSPEVGLGWRARYEQGRNTTLRILRMRKRSWATLRVS